MEIYVWPAEFGLPSMDIKSLQFMVASKFCAAPITFRYATQSWKSPADLPYFINLDNEHIDLITDITHFVEFLRNSKQDIVLDNGLVPSQLYDFDAYNALLHQKLRPAMLQLFWLDRFNYNTIIHQCYSQHLHFPFNIYYMNKIRKQAETIVNATKKTQQQLMLDAIQALNLLSAKLSDNKYFCGDKPCSLDAIVFGYLAPLLRIPLPNDRLQLHLSATPNLVRFVESILSIYIPVAEPILKEQKLSRGIWQRKRDEAQKMMEVGRIVREMKKNEREKKDDDSVKRLVFFVFSSTVLAILFAVHTGIITVERVEMKGKGASKSRKMIKETQST